MVLAEDEIESRTDACDQIANDAQSADSSPDAESADPFSLGAFGSTAGDAADSENEQRPESVVLNDGERCVITERTEWDAEDFAELAMDSEFPVARTDDGHWAFAFPPGADDSSSTDDLALSDEDLAMLALLGGTLPDIQVTVALPGAAVEHNADSVDVTGDGSTTFTWSRDISEFSEGTQFFAITDPDVQPTEAPPAPTAGEPEADESEASASSVSTTAAAPSVGTTTTAVDVPDAESMVEEGQPEDDSMSALSKSMRQ